MAQEEDQRVLTLIRGLWRPLFRCHPRWCTTTLPDRPLTYAPTCRSEMTAFHFGSRHTRLGKSGRLPGGRTKPEPQESHRQFEGQITSGWPLKVLAK